MVEVKQGYLRGLAREAIVTVMNRPGLKKLPKNHTKVIDALLEIVAAYQDIAVEEIFGVKKMGQTTQKETPS